MDDLKGSGGAGKSRLPKGTGKLPRVSISLPDDLKSIIEKEAEGRGITTSKYITDVLLHMHDASGLNIPTPAPGVTVDLSPVMNAISALAGEMQGVKADVHEMKSIVYALPSGSAAQSGTIQMALPISSDEEIPAHEPAPIEVDHSAAQSGVQHSDVIDQGPVNDDAVAVIDVIVDDEPAPAPVTEKPSRPIASGKHQAHPELVDKLDRYLQREKLSGKQFQDRHGFGISNKAGWRNGSKGISQDMIDKICTILDDAGIE